MVDFVAQFCICIFRYVRMLMELSGGAVRCGAPMQAVGRVHEFVLDRAMASTTETIVAIIIIMRSANP